MKTFKELLNEIGFNNSVRPSLDQFQFNDPNQRVDYFKKQSKKRKGSLKEVARKKDRWVDDPDVPYNQQPRNPMRGAGENIINANWHPAGVYHPEEPHVSGSQSFIHPRDNNHRVNIDYNSMEWEHVDTTKGGNGHVASGRTSESLKRHLGNWVKIRRS